MSAIEKYNGAVSTGAASPNHHGDQPVTIPMVSAHEPIELNPFPGIAAAPFSEEQRESLLRAIGEDQVEVRPDGLVYLPEIRYRRILNRTFGPGAWAVMPRAITVGDGDNMLYYRGALFIHGRFVSEAIGEQQYFPHNDRQSYATAAEAAKSNCLVRCCKDLGIASELWDPIYTREWLRKHAIEVWCSNRQDPHKRKKFWRRRDAPPVDMWPWIENEEGVHGDQSGRQAVEARAVDMQKSPLKVHKPAQSIPAAPTTSSPVRSAPQASQKPPRRVSPKQAGRFRAIARSEGWQEREVELLLHSQGFETAEGILLDVYGEMCGFLTKTDVRESFRKKAAGEGKGMNAEKVLNAILE